MIYNVIYAENRDSMFKSLIVQAANPEEAAKQMKDCIVVGVIPQGTPEVVHD